MKSWKLEMLQKEHKILKDAYSDAESIMRQLGLHEPPRDRFLLPYYAREVADGIESMRSTQIIHALAGHPSMSASRPIIECDTDCAVCGVHVTRGARAKDALGSSFTDYDTLAAPSSEIVCVACGWAMMGKPPDTFRMWSVLWIADAELTHSETYRNYDPSRIPEVGRLYRAPGISMTNRGHCGQIVDTLTWPPESPWFCSITTSGQIHTLPFARLNHGLRWSVQFERARVTAHADEFCHVLYHVACLKLLGIGDDAIMTCRPNPAYIKKDPALWRYHSEQLSRYIGSDLLALALWCNTKDNYERTRESARRGYFDRNSREICARYEAQHTQGHDQPRVPMASDIERTGDIRINSRELASDGQQDGPETGCDIAAHIDQQRTQLTLW